MNKLIAILLVCATAGLAADSTVMDGEWSSVAGGMFYRPVQWSSLAGGMFYATASVTSAPPENAPDYYVYFGTNNISQQLSGSALMIYHTNVTMTLGTGSTYYADYAGNGASTLDAYLTLGTNYTVSAWVWWDTVGEKIIFGSIYESVPEYGYLGLLTGGGIYLSANGFVLLGTWTPTAATWYHLTFWRSGINAKLYINGVELAGAGTLSSNNIGYLRGIGGFWDSRAFDIDGRIATVKIWTNALASNVIYSLSQEASP